jgi:asparagine synthase (glutamine-hydrolysing)
LRKTKKEESMCGIVGVWNKKGISINERDLIAIRDTLIHRGPDAAGIYINKNIGFGHRRLSIIDLSEASNQPFQSLCGRYILTFNGEVFNYQEFYTELELKGYHFKTKSDTEVLLYLMMEYSVDCLPRLNGFFAFSFWDNHKKEMILVRDRFGVKPLFYSNTLDKIIFASEPKALFKAGVKKEIDTEHLDELFYYRHVSGANTIFKNVKRVLPGHYWICANDGNNVKEYRWFNLGEQAANINKITNPISWFEDTFHKSIQYRMIADVKVGTLLSGGLDSSSVAYSQFVQGYKNTSTWNIKFSNYEHDESDLASQLSNEYGMRFHSFEFEGHDLVSLVKDAIYFLDEPQMHLQEGHLLGLSKEAKKDVSVLLSGEASDEILGGYVRYKLHDSQLRYHALQFLNYIPEKWLKEDRWKKMKKYLYMRNQDAQIMMNANNLYLKDLEENHLDAFNLLPPYRINLLEEAKMFFPKNRLRQLMYMEQHIHISTLNDRNDRTTMGASIECREPFLDHNIVIGLTSLQDAYFSTKGKGKKLLMNSIGEKLPNYIRNHRKIGLSIPWEKYFVTIPYFRNHIENMHLCPIFQIGNMSQIDVLKIKNDFLTGNRKSLALFRTLFFMSIWYNLTFEEIH